VLTKDVLLKLQLEQQHLQTLPVPRRGWAQRMEMLPTLRENSPSSKHLQEQSSTIWWTNTCSGMVGILHRGFIAQRRSELASFSHKCAIYSRSRALGEVMTLSPRDIGTCSLCMIKGDDITPSDSRRLRRLCINDS
jgi:hypothetical protein